jgi:long-chain acyl-CoA synthetase
MKNDLLGTHDPTSIALVEAGRSISYGELADLVALTAGGLLSRGVSTGDRVAVLGTNDAAVITGLLAAQLIGAVACPLDSRNPISVIGERVTLLSPKALIAAPGTEEAAGAIAAEHLIGRDLIGTPAGSPSADLGPLSTDERAAPVDVDDAEASVILHTSGIVGAPRAAVLTGQNLGAAQRRVVDVGPGLDDADTVFAVLSFAHVLGLNMCLLPSLRVGATLVLQESWDPDESLELIDRHEVTHVVGVPPMWAAWVAAAEKLGSGSNPMRSVTFGRTGASTLHPKVAEGVHERFGVDLAQGYGLTETAGTVTLELAARRHPGSVGKPLPGVEVKLIEDGNEVERGDRGEIWIRTGSVFDGYLGDAPATADVLISDGWCRTGDVGIQDDDDTLYLVGRSKDLINVSGFNVYPTEVEEVLESHPSINEAVVVGEAHDITGERVIAYVTPVDGGAIDTDAVIAHCRDHLSRYKVPASIHLVDRLPLTSTGKRRRNKLRKP